jgi:alpha-beta hydrolase superfamily lysophospholipase
MIPKYLLLGGLPAFLFVHEGPSQKVYTHAIWVTHGRGGQVKDIFTLCETILNDACRDKSVIIIALEERNHGSRQFDKKVNESWDRNVSHPRDIYTLMLGMMYDIQSCMAMLPLYVNTIDQDELLHAVVGVSLGGHVALLCATHLDRVNAAVSLIGSADFQELISQRFERIRHKFLRDASSFEGESFVYFQQVCSENVDDDDDDNDHEKQNNNKKSPKPYSPLSETLTKLCYHFDPIYHVDRLKHQHLLMYSGERDTIVPAICQRRLYEQLMVHRVPDEMFPRLVYREDPNGKHQVTDGMFRQTVEFIHDWLQR